MQPKRSIQDSWKTFYETENRKRKDVINELPDSVQNCVNLIMLKYNVWNQTDLDEAIANKYVPDNAIPALKTCVKVYKRDDEHDTETFIDYKLTPNEEQIIGDHLDYLDEMGRREVSINEPNLPIPEPNAKVEVKDSLNKFAGKGLFAKKSFEEDDLIAYLDGELLPNDEASDISKAHRGYTADWDKNNLFDAYRVNSLGRYVNSSMMDPLKRKANAGFMRDTKYKDGNKRRYKIVAIRKISPGDEILEDYDFTK
jgi:hypothetical protein